MTEQLTAPPSRLSVSDPEIDWEVASRIEVRLDGEVQKFVIEYNCEEGHLLRNMVDADGNLMLSQFREHVLHERVYGDVTVRWKYAP